MTSLSTSTSYSAPPERTIATMFNQISTRYDLLNSILSLKLDERWREAAAQQTLSGIETRLLDVGTGTGKLLETFLRHQPFVEAYGVDVASEMLTCAQHTLGNRARLLEASAHTLPFEDNYFDVVTTGFMLRSLSDLDAAFREMYRVLKPTGKLVVLELTRPRHWFLRMAFIPYMKLYLPLVGRLVSGARGAYHFLSQSVLTFMQVDELLHKLTAAGFHHVEARPLSGGLVTLILARK